jgi:hypothetical protein
MLLRGDVCLQVWFIVSCASFTMMLKNAATHIAKHFEEIEPVPKIEESKNRQLEMVAREKQNLQFLMEMTSKKQKMIAQAQVTQEKIIESYKSLFGGAELDNDGKEHFKATSLNIANTSFQLAMNTFELASNIETRCIPPVIKPQGTDEAASASGGINSMPTEGWDFHADDCAFV